MQTVATVLPSNKCTLFAKFLSFVLATSSAYKLGLTAHIGVLQVVTQVNLSLN